MVAAVSSARVLIVAGMAVVLAGMLVLLLREAPVEAVRGDWPVTLTFEREQVSEPRLGATPEAAEFAFEARGWNDWSNTLVSGSIAGLGPGWFERVDPAGRIEKGTAGRIDHVSQTEGRHLPGPYLSPVWMEGWEAGPGSADATLVVVEDAGREVADRLGLPHDVVVAYTLAEPVTCAQLGFGGCERDAEYVHEVAVHVPTGVPLRVVERYGDTVLTSYRVTTVTFGED